MPEPSVSDAHVASAGGKGKGRFQAFLDQSSKRPGAKDAEKGLVAQAFERRFEVVKSDDEQRLVFGWASVTALDGVEIVDKQDEIIPTAEIEQGAYDFVLNSREQGDMHEKRDVGRLVESIVFTPEKRNVGLVAKNEKGQTIDGWWVGFHVTDPGVWKDHKDGKRPEFSIGGRAAHE